jgi:hypothetical protein
MKALALRPTLQSANIVLPAPDWREIGLRRITEPTAEQNPCCTNSAGSYLSVFQLDRKSSVDPAVA